MEYEDFKSLQIGSIGYNHSHGKDFKLEYPNGIGCYLFLLIKSPSIFVINGKEKHVQENSYVLLSPKTKVMYKPEKDIYIDDWLFFNFDDNERKTFERLEIEFDEPVHLGNLDDLSQVMHFITFEHFSSDAHHIKIKDCYAKILFYKLSRIIKTDMARSSQLFASKNDKLIYLRTKLFEDPLFFSGIDSMATFMSLSRSGIQHLYKTVFKTNIMSDVIAGRVEYAKKLLTSTNLTINEIATKSGYKSEFSFMRQFKEKTNMTPSQFRESDNYIQGSF